jgi:hypothetical protein
MRIRLQIATLVIAVAASAAAGAQTPLHVGFLEPSAAKAARAHHDAALGFAKSRGEVLRLSPAKEGGWQDPQGALHALEECDVVWFHEADQPDAALLDDPARRDLAAYLDGGGVLLLSAAAGRVLNDLAIEPTPLRVLGKSSLAVVSGIRVLDKYRGHPAFAGLDTRRPIPLTSRGCNALADFYDTAGPHGELLAHGGGRGERPLVEYRVGAGRAIFVGWRLADFTTAGDAYRPNLERLFSNLLGYLSAVNDNRARCIRPQGKCRYVRLLGVPFLRAARPVTLAAPTDGFKTAIVLSGDQPELVREMPAGGAAASLPALAVTLSARQQPVARFLADRRAEQQAIDRHDREAIAGLRVLRPAVRLVPAPLRPLETPEVDQSVLAGHSPFMAPGDGEGDVKGPLYEPLEDGGFRITGGTRRLMRPIVHGQNRVWTGDVPIFRMDTVAGNGSYARQERVFPLWSRADAALGDVNPSMGTLRIGAAQSGKTLWLDELAGTTALFRPGYSDYQLSGPGWKASLSIAPALDFHGLVCRVEFDRAMPLVWQYGGIAWQTAEANDNRVAIDGPIARITEANLPGGLVLAGWDGSGAGRAVASPYGRQAEFTADAPRRVYHLCAAWGVTRYDEPRAAKTLGRLDTANAASWTQARDELKRLWFDCYIGRALEPEKHLRQLLAAPDEELRRTRDWWDARRAEFQIRTPDRHLDGLLNWARAASEYHRQGPGLVLGGQIWQMYSHISTGWYGKQWGGDHAAMEQCLRLYAAMQADSGFIRWVSPSLVAFEAEDNTPYWVDQVWRHYTWTGDRRFVADLWPAVRKAVGWMRTHNDPDGDGLFRDGYEYWNCDSNGKGPKAAAPTAMGWAMLDRAARLAAVVGDPAAQREYRALAEKSRTAVFRELWNEKQGRLGSIGSDRLWRGHPQTWEEYLAINAGLLDAPQGRRAMRWIAAHYGFEPQPGVKLLACSDWWPLRWSCQWVPTGDTCLAALAGMKCGDADLWWPYFRTVVGSAFRSEFPGINMGIANTGAGGGDREDVDSDDPHVHATIRGLFGIEPALHEGRLDVCPAFPSAWRQASIRTPDVSYDYRSDGRTATFVIRTPRPTIKRVRANFGGEEIVTPAESESRLTLRLGPALPRPELAARPSILADRQPVPTASALPAAARSRLALVDLSGVCNVTSEEFVATRFTFDSADHPMPLSHWWGNPTLTMPPGPRVLETAAGVPFLTAGRPRPGLGQPPKNLLALSSWQPYPLPGGAVIPLGLHCQRLWLLLQNYVHPMRNYLPNGEVVLHYADGKRRVESLIPPFNLDCYFQHFSREGACVPLGQLGPWPGGWTPIHRGMATAHADALEIACDADSLLESVELRATCSEGMLGLAGLTALSAEPVAQQSRR